MHWNIPPRIRTSAPNLLKDYVERALRFQWTSFIDGSNIDSPPGRNLDQFLTNMFVCLFLSQGHANHKPALVVRSARTARLFHTQR
jgi:hypothetical protein